MSTGTDDDRTWTVKRRWVVRHDGRGLRERLHQRRRARGQEPGGHWWDVADLSEALDSPAAWLLGIVAAVVVVALLGGAPLLLAAIDAVVVLVVALGGIVARVLFRRPWTIEAVASDGERRTRQVSGWRAAGRVARDWATELAGASN